MTPAICLALALSLAVICVLSYVGAVLFEWELIGDIASAVCALSFLGAVGVCVWGVWLWALSLS
jgi:hypothetical protein